MKMENKQVIEITGAIAVVLSLIFVGLELRQSTVASKAASYQALGMTSIETWRLKAENRDLNNIIDKFSRASDIEVSNMRASDISLARAFVISVLRANETAFLQVESGLLDPEAMVYLGMEGFMNSNLLQRMWPQVKGSLSIEYLDYLDGRFEFIESNH
jgi:hypothetical protein